MKITQKKKQAKKSFFASLREQDVSTIDLLKYKRCNDDGVLITKEDTFQQFLKIRTNDLDSLNKSELTDMLDGMTNTARTYTDDVKLVVLTSKTDTTIQQEYWRNNMKQAQNELLTNLGDPAMQSNKQVSLENIQRLKEVELKRPDLNFYFVIFASEINDLHRKKRLIMRTASSYRLRPLLRNETEHVLYRLNNMNDE